MSTSSDSFLGSVALDINELSRVEVVSSKIREQIQISSGDSSRNSSSSDSSDFE